MTRTITMKIDLTGEAEEQVSNLSHADIEKHMQDNLGHGVPGVKVTLVPGWQDIIAAPEDTEIIVYDAYTARVTCSEYVTAYKDWHNTVNPTHFQLLPEPPTESKADE